MNSSTIGPTITKFKKRAGMKVKGFPRFKDFSVKIEPILKSIVAIVRLKSPGFTFKETFNLSFNHHEIERMNIKSKRTLESRDSENENCSHGTKAEIAK